MTNLFEALRSDHDTRRRIADELLETHGADGDRHSVSEHKGLDDYIDQLEGYEMSAPQWIQTAEELVRPGSPPSRRRGTRGVPARRQGPERTREDRAGPGLRSGDGPGAGKLAQ